MAISQDRPGDGLDSPDGGEPIEVTSEDGHLTVHAVGPWLIDHAAAIEDAVSAIPWKCAADPVTIDLGRITMLDTTGAWILYRMRRDAHFDGIESTLVNARESHSTLIDTIAHYDAPCPIEPKGPPPFLQQVEDLGRGTVNVWHSFIDLVGFLGVVTATFGRVLINPRRMRWTPLVNHMEHVGLKAMPIVGLMALLIGVVIAQQGEFQLRRFGGGFFVVDLLGISILREIGILLTAIMIAGRSGSAFTAQIGTMVLNEEVDAMRTLGIDPIETLVLPRVLALVIMLPILTFYANVVALFGGGLFAWLSLDIAPGAFIRRLNDAITLDTFLVGMIKAPFFALVISTAGCFEGMRVLGGAESVGHQTTRSVVESIFLVIVLDAMFAIFFSVVGM